MNKFKIILLSLILCFTVFCNNNKKDLTTYVSIEILYLKGLVETRGPVSCGAIKKTKSLRKVDTVLVDKQICNDIVTQIKLLKELKTDSFISNCDVRIQCKINYANGDSVNLCIGEFNCIIKDGQRMRKNDTLIYLIRKHSGYYNYFSKEELSYFDELKLFKIPNDYKDLRRISNPDSIPLPPL